eukprot:g34165.t1
MIILLCHESMGLTLNICKTNVFHQSGPTLRNEPPIIKVYGEASENVGHSQHLMGVLSTKSVIDEEIRHCLQCVNAVLACLRKRVFEDNNIRSDTKIVVYRAVVVPALLYASETWTVHSRNLRALE